MPIGFGTIQARFKGGAELVVLRCFAEVIPPALIAKPCQPYCFGVQRFGKTTFKAFTISWTQLFSLIGSRVIISEPAATKMASTAAVVGSIGNKDSVGSLAVLEKSSGARNSLCRYIPGSDFWVWTIALRMANT